MKKKISEYQNIHLIGIGGASMYAIAAMLKNDGKHVTGSDMQASNNTKYLENIGIPITIGHNIEVIKTTDLVIYTAAIGDDDPELNYARANNIETVDRSVFLGEYTKDYENLICISGTHGKSTTTSMLASIFLEAKLNPTIHIGAALKKINGNYYIGDKKYFILEACEYVDSFLHFHPTSEIILNIDNDHLDYFKNIENIKKSFQKYIDLLPEDGFLVLNADDVNIRDLNIHHKNVLTYGMQNHANRSILKKALKEFTGVGRRFEYLGEYNGAHFFDDFAHHPTEIASTYESSKAIHHHKSWAVFQSHTYSRTYEHLQEFADILSKFDHVIICDIYPAREVNIWNVKEDDLVELIKVKNPNVKHIPTYEEIAEYLKKNIENNDLVITIGAGPINQVTQMILNKK